MEQQSDYQTRLYTYSRDVRVTSTQTWSGSTNTLFFDQIYPNTNYSICGYYQDTTVTSAGATCSNFTTNNYTWYIYRAVYNFSAVLTDAQRNKLLCYVKNNTKANNEQVINIRG